MACTFVILGAIGDLTSRFLVPALGELTERGELSEGVDIVAVARHDLDDDEFREQLRSDAPDGTGPGFDAVVERIRYVEGDATDRDVLDGLVAETDGPVVTYLALPPAVFDDTISALAATSWADRLRLAVEKPFGEGLDAARHLNEVLADHVPESSVYRVDHFLHQPLVQRLPGLRSSPVLAALWESGTIETIDVVWDETIALEGRAGYYDSSGALVDMVQNHLLQVLTVLAMDVPEPIEVDTLAAARLDVLRRLEADVDQTVRARYTDGRVDGHPVPAYVDEEGVDPDAATETFTEVPLTIDDARWRHTAVRLRTGKALAADRGFVRIGVRGGDELVLGVEPFTLGLTVDGAGLAAPVATDQPSPYAGVLGALVAGDRTWFVSGPEAEEQWRIVEPVRESWSRGTPPLLEYPAGSDGPATG